MPLLHQSSSVLSPAQLVVEDRAKILAVIHDLDLFSFDLKSSVCWPIFSEIDDQLFRLADI